MIWSQVGSKCENRGTQPRRAGHPTTRKELRLRLHRKIHITRRQGSQALKSPQPMWWGLGFLIADQVAAVLFNCSI